MRRIVIVSAYPERVNGHWRLAYPWTVLPMAGSGLREDWHEVAQWAVESGWDENVIVMQDDFIATNELPPHRGHITSYADASGPGHVCPRGFSATADAWETLAEAWGPPYERGQNCLLWSVDCVYEGVSEYDYAPA